jgi:hypothetical protein
MAAPVPKWGCRTPTLSGKGRLGKGEKGDTARQ